MSTWHASEPISHPWFRQATSKRKFFHDSPTSSRSGSRSPSPPPSKRRRQAVLEAGFSSLSLSGPEPGISGGQTYALEESEYPLMEDDYVAPVVVLPSTVEEPDIPEVKMKSSSWYEPEPDRIVVTSLESSDEEDEEADPADTTCISISSALLQKIAKHSTRDPLPLTNQSQALVLYKPLPVLGVDCEEDKEDEKPCKKTDNVAEDDDAMDVEP